MLKKMAEKMPKLISSFVQATGASRPKARRDITTKRAGETTHDRERLDDYIELQSLYFDSDSGEEEPYGMCDDSLEVLKPPLLITALFEAFLAWCLSWAVYLPLYTLLYIWVHILRFSVFTYNIFHTSTSLLSISAGLNHIVELFYRRNGRKSHKLGNIATRIACRNNL